LFRLGTNTYYPTNVSVQLALNNLIEVDDITATIVLDLYLRIYWTDPRIYLPQIYQYLNPKCKLEGIDITAFIFNGATPLNFWLPDIAFYTINDINTLVQMVKLFPNGYM
jgi:hypothetical protein